MSNVLGLLVSLATLVFAVSSMLSVGLAHTLKDIVGPLRSAGAVIRALAANFVFVPILAYLIIHALALEQPVAIGLMLVATAAGAPFVIRLTTAAGGDVGLSATLLVLLLPATILYMPIAVPMIVPGIRVSVVSIALPLVLTMLLPLALGLFVKRRKPGWADRFQPLMAHTSRYSLMALIGLTVLANLPEMLNVTMRTVLAALLLIVGAFGLGYLLGGRDPDRRDVLGLGTGQRNIAAATVVATQSLENPVALVTVIVASLVGLAALFPIAAWLRNSEARRSGRAWGTGRGEWATS